MANPTIPIDYADLKKVCRKGFDTPETRQYWWPHLPGLTDSVKCVTSVEDTVAVAERLTEILKEPLLAHNTATIRSGENPVEQVVRRISYVLINQNKLEDVEVSYFVSLLRILVWQLNRVDVSYYVCTEIINNPDK
jgi:hypothetical protein